MSDSPVICFGQQPCGIFPRRFLFAKIETVRRLQAQVGGEIIFFYHDSDHDPRETKTILRHRKNGEILAINFTFANKLQRKFSPLYLKRVLADWQTRAAYQIRGFVDPQWVEAFEAVPPTTVSCFCLEMYRRMGLLDGIRVLRSSDPDFRRAACDVSDFYVDVVYQGETVRARYVAGELKLHEGGDAYITLPTADFTRENISPARDTRLKWMQSVIHCTHYVSGASEQDYLRKEDAPEITYVKRDTIDRSDEAYVGHTI
jgi:hypothetical protein